MYAPGLAILRKTGKTCLPQPEPLSTKMVCSRAQRACTKTSDPNDEDWTNTSELIIPTCIRTFVYANRPTMLLVSDIRKQIARPQLSK
jgi:hypothetical protein